MPAIRPALVLVAVVAAGCGRVAAVDPPFPVKASPHPTDANTLRARQKVREAYATARTPVVKVDVTPTATAGRYRFTCTFMQALDGEVCLGRAAGQIDLATGKLDAPPAVTDCGGPSGDAA